jgi:hypothetical protein
MWEHEHEYVNMTESFLKHSTNVKKKIGTLFLDTWQIIYHDVKEYSTMCTWMNDNYDDKKMDEN